MLDYVSDFDIFCWRSKNMLYFLENRAWNGAFEKPLLMLRRFFESPPVLPWTLRNLRKPTSPPLNLKFFLKSTRPSFIDKAGCTRQFESELSLRSLASLFPIKEGSTSFSKPFFHGEGWLHSAIWKWTFIALICTTFPLRVQGMCQPPFQ